MLQGEHSAILLTFIKQSFVIKIFVLFILSGSFSQVLLYTGIIGNGHSWSFSYNSFVQFQGKKNVGAARLCFIKIHVIPRCVI